LKVHLSGEGLPAHHFKRNRGQGSAEVAATLRRHEPSVCNPGCGGIKPPLQFFGILLGLRLESRRGEAPQKEAILVRQPFLRLFLRAADATVASKNILFVLKRLGNVVLLCGHAT
jgi:hypothetical protein